MSICLDAFALLAWLQDETGVPLVTGDPELKELEREGMISLRWIGTA